MKKIFASLLLVLGFSACETTVYYGPVDRVDSFINLLNDQSAFDSHFYLVKHPNQTATEGFVVVYSADSGYMAYDIYNYIAGDSWSTYSSYADYQEVYIHDSFSDIYGEVFYVGDTYYNDAWGTYAGEFVFETNETAFKDLEKVVALKQAYKQEKIAETLVAQYGLSQERSVKVAKMVSAWEKASKNRQLTDADANAFSKELIGFDVSKATSAFKNSLQGDSAQMDDLLEKAAAVNGTTPEHMNQIFSGMLQ